MTLHIQTYLRNGGTVESLHNEFGITAKRHRTHTELILFKYSMIDSPMGNPIVQECRGIILNEDDNWNVVFHSMDKFFNYGEGHAAIVKFKTSSCQEKVDGSLLGMYLYKGAWEVCTSGTPDASGEVNASGKSFRDYFNEALNYRFNNGEADTNNFNYWFELTGPLNRVVVVHDKVGLTLLGARNIHTGKEVHPSTVAHLFPGIPVVIEFGLQSIEDVIRTFDTMSPLKQEGYVIVDADFNRIKVKHPGYVAIHHAKDGWTIKSCVEVVRSGEMTEVTATVLTTYPEYKPMLDDAKQRYDALIEEIEAEYKANQNIPAQKDFALAIKNSRCSGALFQLRAGKVKSIREALAKCNLDVVMRLMGY